MAIYIDSGDNRDYTANTINNHFLRIPNIVYTNTATGNQKNWPGKIAGINVATVGIASFTTTFYHATEAPKIKKDSSSGGGFNTGSASNGSYGLTLSDTGESHFAKHATVPGHWFQAGNLAFGSSGNTVHYRVEHSVDNSQPQSTFWLDA